MGYGVTILCGKLRKCGQIKWMDVKGGYSFYKFGDWELEQQSILDTEYEDDNESKYIYWYKSDVDSNNYRGELTNRDDYNQSRKKILTSKIIQDLKKKVKSKHYNNAELEDAILSLTESFKEGYKYSIFVGT